MCVPNMKYEFLSWFREVVVSPTTQARERGGLPKKSGEVGNADLGNRRWAMRNSYFILGGAHLEEGSFVAAELLRHGACRLRRAGTGQLKTRGLLDRKRTSIWTNTTWKPARDLCKNDCGHVTGKTHDARAQQGGPGPSFSQRELYRIPADLCAEVAQACLAARL